MKNLCILLLFALVVSFMPAEEAEARGGGFLRGVARVVSAPVRFIGRAPKRIRDRRSRRLEGRGYRRGCSRGY